MNTVADTPLLFEPHGLVSDPQDGWRMFRIAGSKAAMILWVRPCSAYCETCRTAFVVHDESTALVEKAIGASVKGGKVVCLCEGKFLE
jgi:hypothetical protein